MTNDPFDTNETATLKHLCNASQVRINSVRQSFLNGARHTYACSGVSQERIGLHYVALLEAATRIAMHGPVPDESIQDYLDALAAGRKQPRFVLTQAARERNERANTNYERMRNAVVGSFCLDERFDIEAFAERRRQDAQFLQDYQFEFSLMREIAGEIRKPYRFMAEAEEGFHDNVTAFRRFQAALSVGFNLEASRELVKTAMTKSRVPEMELAM